MHVLELIGQLLAILVVEIVVLEVLDLVEVLLDHLLLEVRCLRGKHGAHTKCLLKHAEHIVLVLIIGLAELKLDFNTIADFIGIFIHGLYSFLQINFPILLLAIIFEDVSPLILDVIFKLNTG